MRALRRLLQDSRAATAIEFALLAGPFLLLVFGVMEFSRGLWTRQALTNVTTSAARCVAVAQSECTDAGGAYSEARTLSFVRESARSLGVTLVDPIVITPNTSCDGVSGFASVAVEAQFDSLFPIDWVMTFSSQSCFARQP